MHPTTEKLLRLNRVEGYLRSGWPPRAQAALVKDAAALRRAIEPEFLAHYDQLKAAGREAVVPVIDGVCHGCLVKLSPAAISALEHTKGVHQCESCGCFIYCGLSSFPTAIVPKGDDVKPTTTSRLVARHLRTPSPTVIQNSAKRPPLSASSANSPPHS